MARRSDSSGCVRSLGSPWRGTLLKGIPGGPVHLNHVPLGGRRSRTRATAVVDGPLDRHTLIDDALVRRTDPPTKRPRKRNTVTLDSQKNTSSTDPCLRMAAQKGSRARSSRIPADLPIDVMDASRRILIRGMHDN